jgi:Rha family phage regulatory protein
VAETFGKRHDNVLRDIENLDCSAGFRLLNFEEIKHKDDWGRMQPMVIMAKDGFTFLVMGYRGKKAVAFKEAYINRFNDMEAFISEQYAARMGFPQFTEAVQMAHGEPKSYHFSNECDMINKIALGVPVKAVRASNGVKPGDSIRPYLSDIQIADIRTLQMADIGLLTSGVEFQERKRALAEYHGRRKVVRLSA